MPIRNMQKYMNSESGDDYPNKDMEKLICDEENSNPSSTISNNYFELYV